MVSLQLKSYQSAALTTLSVFLRDAALTGASSAFRNQTGRSYLDEPFGPVPCICLRIPTGGGKTPMESHAIVGMARDWHSTDAPVAVWLVPSDAIRSQTLSALQTPGHPYRVALEDACGQRLHVCDLERVRHFVLHSPSRCPDSRSWSRTMRSRSTSTRASGCACAVPMQVNSCSPAPPRPQSYRGFSSW